MKAHLAGICGLGRILVFILFLLFLAPPGRRLRQAHVQERLHGRHSNQLVESFLAEDLIDALAVSRDRGRQQHGIRGRMQLEMLLGMRQRVVRDQRRNVRKLGRLRFQEFFSRRGIEEEITDRDRRSPGQAGLVDARHPAAIDLDDGSGRGFFCGLGRRSCFEVQAGHRSDRRQRFAAKS